MALILLRVLVLGVLAAAADDASITWHGGKGATLACVVPHPGRLATRRPPPPLEDGRPRPRFHLWRRADNDTATFAEVSHKRISANGSLDVSRHRDGLYQCLVRQPGGLVMGYPIDLKFANIEKQFSHHPEGQKTRPGQPVALSCNISSSPPADVSWTKDDQPVLEDDRHYILQHQLLIMNVTENDAGSYRCIATNPYANKTKTSHAGSLEVKAGGGDQALDFLPLEYQENILAPRGSRVVLPCPIVGSPRPEMIWKLVPPDDRPRELDVTDHIFVIYSLQQDQEGVYTCSVEGSGLTRSFTVTMTQPVVIESPPTGKEARRASTVRFNCTASGRPEPTITWYKDGQPLAMAGRINLLKSSDGRRTELVISGVTSNDAGVYQCFAHNAVSMNSSWAVLNVTGADAASPVNVQCWPVGDDQVKVKWQQPPDSVSIAYTIHGTPEDKPVNSHPGNPYLGTEQIITVKQPLVPFRFQVRAYVQTASGKNTASDFSKAAVCQTQGIPIKLSKVDASTVQVSWQQFAEQTPGVVQWILQYRSQDSSQEHNITLDGSVHNYTFENVSPSSPLKIRLLGSKSLTWLQQDLSLVPWTSTAAAEDPGDGDDIPVPQDIRVTELTSHSMTVTWRGVEGNAGNEEGAGGRFLYTVCLRRDGAEDKNLPCKLTPTASASFEGLTPGTEYEVAVQARLRHHKLGGGFSAPYVVNTPFENPQRFRGLEGHFVNSSTLRVSWNGPPALYRVHYSFELKLPVLDWNSIDTTNNTVLIPNIDPTDMTFVMVTGYDPEEHSNIETIQPLVKDLEAKDIHYEHVSGGIRVWWEGGGPRVVSYAQNITRAVEQWASVVATEPSVYLTDLDPSKTTYVMVTASKKHQSQVLTIEPLPEDNSTLYLVVGTVVGLASLCLLAFAAVFIWRKRKRPRSPNRPRRRNVTSNEENAEEESEMKGVGGRLANGRARGAGEPLLNGHVHITENPTSKTPNGKMKKGHCNDAAFDVSRHEEPDPDCTLETVLDADTSTTSYSLLDASRKPEFDLSRPSRDISANNSFTKLPDDNMNSELTRSTLDNSKILPTLQPNG